MKIKSAFLFCFCMQTISLPAGFFGTLAGRLAGRIVRDFTSRQNPDDMQSTISNRFRTLADPNTPINDPVEFTQETVFSLILPPTTSPSRTVTRLHPIEQPSSTRRPLNATTLAHLFNIQSKP